MGEDGAIVEDLGGVEKKSMWVVTGDDDEYSVGEEDTQVLTLHEIANVSSFSKEDITL